MPEGDTLRRTAQRLHQALAGDPLERVDLRWGSLDGAALVGSRTLEVVSHGKRLLHRVEGGWTIHSHLRMEGQWRLEALGSPAADRGLRNPQVRAVLDAGSVAQGWRALGLRLGELDLLRTTEEARLVGHLGPDILGADLDASAVADSLQAAGRPLAEVLLDQRLVAGIGTFWASEILFLERVLPWTPGRDLGDAVAARITDRLHRLMDLARRTGWQASTGVQRSGEEAYVHARSGRPCRRCGDTVRVAMTGLAPRARTLFSCPTCQGGLAPTDEGRPQRPLGSGGSGSGRTGSGRSGR